MSEPVKEHLLTEVLWREYEFDGTNGRVTYRIEQPWAFYWAPGHSTHRVVDSEGVVHIVPAPGSEGCVVRYKKPENVKPVEF